MLKKNIEFISRNEKETRNFAQKWVRTLPAGMVLALAGDLGSGKTVFVKGLASGLGIKELVTSPTFNIIQVYEGIRKLYHFDLYRLYTLEEAENIGYQEYFRADGFTVIEWADKFPEIIPDNSYWIYFEHLGRNKRRIKILIR